MDITILSTADWEHPFWTNKQHTAKGLAELGHRVLYVDSIGLRKIVTTDSGDKSRIIKKIKNFFRSPTKINDNLYVLSPLIIPVHENKYIHKFNSLFLSFLIKFTQIRLNMKNEIFWTFNPMSFEIAKRLNPEKLVYNNVDDLTAAPGMPANLEAEEVKLFSFSNYVFNTSKELHRRASQHSKNSFEFTNVADYKHFSHARDEGEIPADLKSIGNPIVGFVGAISPYKLDFELISSFAKKNKDVHLVLVGKVGEGQPGFQSSLEQLDNIHLLGPKKYQELPNYLRGMDVLIIPSVVNNYTKSMFPMKFFEYLATEKPIVARTIDSLKEFEDVFYNYESYDQFENAIHNSIENGTKDIELSRELARQYTWENRLNKMLKIIS